MSAPPEGDQGLYQPRARSKHVVVTVGNKMFIWGGWAGTDQYSRTLASFLEIFDFTSGAWSSKRTRGTPPRGLIDPAYTCVGGRKLYVFGGYDGMASKRCTNDLHELDLNTLEWKKVVPNNYLDVVGTPRPMYGARMVTGNHDVLVMYGGMISPDQISGDIFVYDILNGIWEKMAISGSKPPKLSGHTFTKIDRSKVVLFGGQTEGKCISDVYILSLDSWSWSKISMRGAGVLGTGAKPSPRTNHSACHITGAGKPVLLITGGKSSNGTVLDEFWIMDLEDRIWRQVDVGDQEKPRHSHSTVMFGTGRERVVTVTNGGQSTRNDQPLGLAFPYLINSVFHLEKETRSQNWIVTKIIYKQKESAKPASSTPSASNTRQPHQIDSLSQDIHRGINNHLQPLINQHGFNDLAGSISHSPQRRGDILNPHGSLPSSSTMRPQEDRSELIKAKSKADEMEKRASEMEKRATDAEKNLYLTLQELTRANDKVAVLQEKLEEMQQKATLLEQKFKAQLEDRHESNSQVEESAMAALQRALNAEDSAFLAKAQLAQAEDQVNLTEARLIQADQTVQALQHQLSVAEQRRTEAEHRIEEVLGRLNQMERRAVEAEARATQAERSAQLSQHQAFNSEMRAREAEREKVRRVAEAEQEVRDANARTERAERRAAYVDRGEERMWALEREEITLTEVELGRGGWAAVKVAKFRGIDVAAKCIYNTILSDHNRALFVREMNMAARLRHPNLVQFIGATVRGEPLILMELMPTTLRLELRHGPPSHAQILAISKDVAKALNYMHLMQPDSLIHRDVSSANVLLDPAPNDCWKVKLSDYGSVNFVQRTVSAGPGNPLYAAPEANNPDLHSTKMDVYSYGVLLSEMCSGQFPDAEHMILVERVNDEQMADLVGHCLSNERDRRPTMGNVLAILNEL